MAVSERLSPSLEHNIPWEVMDKIIPNNTMLETDTNPFTLTRLNALHNFAATLTQRNIKSSHDDIITIADIGSDNMFPLKPLLTVLENSQKSANIFAIDLNATKLQEGMSRPELEPYFQSESLVKIHPRNENATNINLADESLLEARLIGVLDGTVHGDPKDLLEEIYRILKPNGNAMVSFRSPYLDRLLPAIEQAGKHMTWNTVISEPTKTILQKGYPLSRKNLTVMLMELGYSSVTFYGQFPVSYSYQEQEHNGKKISEYEFENLPHLKAIHYQGESVIIPSEKYCQFHQTQQIDLKDQRLLLQQYGRDYLEENLNTIMSTSELIYENKPQFTQYMFWFADIMK